MEPMQWCRSVFAIKAVANLSWVLHEHRAVCLFSPALLLARRNQSSDAVLSKNPSKSTPAHDAVAAAVLHKHHLIIHVGAGLIQFVSGYWSLSRLATEVTRHRKAFSPFFARVFDCVTKKMVGPRTRTAIQEETKCIEEKIAAEYRSPTRLILWALQKINKGIGNMHWQQRHWRSSLIFLLVFQ